MSTATAPPSSTARVRGRRSTLLLVAVVLAAVGLAVWAGSGSGRDGALDPRNPGPGGAEATARVLADQGIDVDVARGQSALLDADVDATTTVVVTGTRDLGTSTFATLERHTRRAGALVVAGDGAAVSARYPAGRPVTRSGGYDADCDDPLVGDLRVDVGDAADGYTAGRRSCFSGLLLAPAARTRWLPGADVLSNDHVLDADNAALAVRLLGQHPRLVWYVADAADLRADDGVGLRPLLPDWLLPGLALLGLAGTALLVWQGRRLGPLVREPLPVVVRAVETTESRGRLYRRSGDRDHAARSLRDATRRRVAARLTLAPDSSAVEVAGAVAGHLARPLDPVAALLEDRPVRSDSDLARLGRDLLRLEEEVHDR